MSLSEDLEREAQRLKAVTPGCKTCEWLQTLENKEVLVTMIDEWYQDGLPHLNLVRILQQNGFPGGETSARRHRNQCVPKRGQRVD